MKDNLPYFSHDNNARNHPKMKALIAEFGFEGYGRFWVLNERIAESSGACIDISRKVNKLDLANELRLDGKGLDDFLNFLADPEIDLINITDGIITTDRINELFSKAMGNRESERNRKRGKNGNDDCPAGNSPENTTFRSENDTDKIREDKTKQDKIKQESGACAPVDGSDEPPQSFQDALELSTLLLTAHRQEIPDYLAGKDDKQTVSRWAADIEKLIRIDQKPPETIRLVILWTKTPGNFWFHNIESGKKLREKFERLYGQMQTDAKKSGTGPPVQHRIAADYVPREEVASYFKEME